MDPAPAASGVEGNESAIGCINPRTRRRRGKRGISTSIDSLPDDLLSEILVRLPADEIHRNARLVCRRWKLLVRSDAFVGAHFRRASYGLLIADSKGAPTIHMTAAARGRIEVSKLNYLKEKRCVGSCDGLNLGISFSRHGPIVVSNPAIKRSFNLPRLGFVTEMVNSGIAYAAASMKYKVVASYVYSYRLPTDFKLPRHAILTVGVDRIWRDIMIKKLSPRARMFLLGNNKLLSTEGFVHWVRSWENYVLTMNVETETIAETPAPPVLDIIKYRCASRYLSTGRHLSLLVPIGSLSWEVWEMKGETGEWRKVVNKIDLEAHKCRIPIPWEDCVLLEPVAWVKYPDVLAFRYGVYRSCILYNLDTDSLDSVEVDLTNHDVTVHRSSLVWFS